METRELKRYIALIARWLWFIGLGTAIAAGAAYFVSSSQTRIYQAPATLLVNQGSTSSTFIDYSSLLTSERLVRTYTGMITKRPVLEEVGASLRLPYPYEVLASKVNVQAVRDTSLFELSVEDPDPRMAALIANKIGEVFIAQIREAQLGQVESLRQNLAAQIRDLEGQIRETSQAMDSLRQGIDSRSPDARQAEIARLQSTLSQYQITYSNLIKSYQDMQLAEAKTINTVQVVDPAVEPSRPIRPKVSLNTLLGALLGLILSAAVAFFIEYMDDTVKTPDDVTRLVSTPTLGAIARMDFSADGKSGGLVADTNPRSTIAEAFKVLRTNVQFSAVDAPHRTILVTSANPGEGKTTTLANLAVVMAQAGRKVIAVDSDLRRPALHKFFDSPNTSGLTNLLISDDAKIDNYLQNTKVDGLRILPSGPIPPNPSELLGSRRMESLLSQLQEKADLVLFDSPPVLGVADPRILASKTDGTILVVDTGKTRAGALTHAMSMLRQGSSNILGVILNKLVPRGEGYGYYYYYYYYGREYSEEEPSSRKNKRRSSKPSSLLPPFGRGSSS